MAAALGWAAVLCAVLLAQTYIRAGRPDGIDLTSYLLSARALVEGRSPYLLPTPFPYLYPVTLAFLLIPLAFVPSMVAVLVWFALSVVAAVWSIRTVLLQARPDLTTRSADVAVFLAAFFTMFFTIAQSNLRNGQVNFIVLALCVLAAFPSGPPAREAARQLFFTGAGAPPPARAIADAARQTARHGRRRLRPLHPALAYSASPPISWLLAVASWSLAVAIKIIPLALLPYFLLRRSWAWLLAAVVLIAAWCLLPAVLARTRIFDIYEQYWRMFLAMSLEPREQPLDFSLAGTIAWIARVPMTPMLKASAAAVVIGWILQADARRLRPSNIRAFALYTLAIPLVSPQSEVHHLAFMLPAAAVAGAALWRAWRQSSLALKIAAAFAVAFYLAATATPVTSGPLFCASMIAFGAAVMNVASAVDSRELTVDS